MGDVEIVSETQGVIPKVEYNTHLTRSGRHAREQRVEVESGRRGRRVVLQNMVVGGGIRWGGSSVDGRWLAEGVRKPGDDGDRNERYRSSVNDGGAW